MRCRRRGVITSRPRMAPTSSSRSSDLLQTLLGHDLVDEFRIWTFLVVVGPGKRLFERHDARRHAVVVTRRPRARVVMATYRRWRCRSRLVRVRRRPTRNANVAARLVPPRAEPRRERRCPPVDNSRRKTYHFPSGCRQDEWAANQGGPDGSNVDGEPAADGDAISRISQAAAWCTWRPGFCRSCPRSGALLVLDCGLSHGGSLRRDLPDRLGVLHVRRCSINLPTGWHRHRWSAVGSSPAPSRSPGPTSRCSSWWRSLLGWSLIVWDPRPPRPLSPATACGTAAVPDPRFRLDRWDSRPWRRTSRLLCVVTLLAAFVIIWGLGDISIARAHAPRVKAKWGA